MMMIDFVPIDYHNMRDCETLSKWFNDPEINYLLSPNFQQGDQPSISPVHISKINAYSKFEKYAYFILCDGLFVGDVNIIDNPDFLLKTNENSGWLGITIGEKPYRGLGIGKIAMNFIEQTAKEIGFNRIELGVFEFNKKAIEFYKKLGYQQFGVVPKFTFYKGIWYDDLRFEKYI